MSLDDRIQRNDMSLYSFCVSAGVILNAIIYKVLWFVLQLGAATGFDFTFGMALFLSFVATPIPSPSKFFKDAQR